MPNKVNLLNKSENIDYININDYDNDDDDDDYLSSSTSSSSSSSSSSSYESSDSSDSDDDRSDFNRNNHKDRLNGMKNRKRDRSPCINEDIQNYDNIKINPIKNNRKKSSCKKFDHEIESISNKAKTNISISNERENITNNTISPFAEQPTTGLNNTINDSESFS